jgi:hypothetical protein
MKVRQIAVFVVAAGVLVCAGCRSKAIDPADLRFALDDYYRLQPHCLWPSDVNLPAQADNSSEAGKQFRALAAAGMLDHRPVGESGSVEYGLSPQGKGNWTANGKEPGWGNFCFARPEVTSIDSMTPPATTPAIAYTVHYRYTTNRPEWANSAAIKAAFPQVAAEGDGSAAATLVRSGTLWQVQNVRQ